MPKILIIAGDATEDLEFFYPYQRMLEEGYETKVAAPSRKKLQFVVHDFVEGFDTYIEREGHSWPSDLALSEVDPEEYAALVLPGGRAPEYLRNDSDYRRVVTHFFDEDKPVAHICHAALTLAPSASSRAAVPPPTLPARRMWRWAAGSSSTVRRSSTARSSRRVRGTTSRSGCGRSWRCCGSMRR